MIIDGRTVLDQLEHARHGLSEPRRVTVTLTGEDSAWNPASTKRVIYGPAKVTYTQHADGGVDAEVTR